MDGTADLTSVFIPQKAPVVRYGQGELIGWNPDTFENTVRYNGQLFYNLDVKAGADALSWATPQTVDLKIIDSSGDQGASQMVIDGRIIRPGAGNAEEVITFMRGTLAREIAAEVFAERIFIDTDAGLAERTATTYGDPQTGDPGPSVTDVPIESGRAIVFLGADMQAATDHAATNDYDTAGFIGYEVSGATSVPPSDPDRAMFSAVQKYNLDGVIDFEAGVSNLFTMAKIVVEENLNPGLHDFTMKYKAFTGTARGLSCAARTIVVIGL